MSLQQDANRTRPEERSLGTPPMARDMSAQGRLTPSPEMQTAQQKPSQGLVGQVEGGARAFVSDVKTVGGDVVKADAEARNFLGTNTNQGFQEAGFTREQGARGAIQRSSPPPSFIQKERDIGPSLLKETPIFGPAEAGVSAGSLAIQRAAPTFATRVASDIGLSSSYSALSSGTTNPEKLGEAALFGAGVGAAGGVLGGSAGKLADYAERFKAATGPPPSTIEEPSGLYRGTVGGQPSFISKLGDIAHPAPKTPGFELTDIPSSESRISSTSFGERYAQSKFGISATPGVSYEFEYKGGGRSFEYSPETVRQETFTRSGPSGPGYTGGGSRGGQVFEQEQSLRTPTDSFSPTEQRLRLFQDEAVVRSEGFSFGLPSPIGLTKNVTSTVPAASTGAIQSAVPSTTPIQGQGSQMGSLVGPAFGSIGGTTTQPTYVQQGIGQSQGQGNVNIQVPSSSQVSAFGNPQPATTAAVSTGAFGLGFAQPFSDRKQSGSRVSKFGFRQLKHPGIENYLDIGLAGKTSKRRKK